MDDGFNIPASKSQKPLAKKHREADFSSYGLEFCKMFHRPLQLRAYGASQRSVIKSSQIARCIVDFKDKQIVQLEDYSLTLANKQSDAVGSVIQEIPWYD